MSEPVYDVKKTAKKALRDAAHGAATAGVVAAVATVASPEVAEQVAGAVAAFIPPPWNLLAVLAIPGLIAGVSKAVTDWSVRAPSGPVHMGKSAVAAARAKFGG